MIPFLDLSADFAEIEVEARARMDGVLARQLFVLGPETEALEHALQLRLGAEHAIACSSGSDALSLALTASGVGAGDAVVVPAWTFFASAGAIARAGAQPVFCDIDEASFNAGAAAMAAAIEREFDSSQHHRGSGARLRAVMPVHLYGRAAAMPEVMSLARSLDIRVIEDAAQAIDAHVAGTAAGTFGDVGAFSFYPTKNLGGPGDGGLLVTNDASIAARLRRLRMHGAAPGSYEHEEVGVNARMAELVAAVLNAKLERLSAWTQRRCEIASHYRRRLQPAHDAGLLRLPGAGEPGQHVWHQLVVRIPSGGARSRDEVRDKLESGGISVRVFYPQPLHLQTCFAALGYRRGDLPVCERAAAEVLCLPIYPSLCASLVDRVCDGLLAALER